MQSENSISRKFTMSHITPRKEGRSGHLFKIEMMLLCNSISLGDDLSDGRREGAKNCRQRCFLFLRPTMIRRTTAMPNCSPFLSSKSRRAPPPPPPFSAECRQNIKISERYRITRALPSLSDHLHVLLRHQKQLDPRSELDSESNPAFFIILKINSFLSFHQDQRG